MSNVSKNGKFQVGAAYTADGAPVAIIAVDAGFRDTVVLVDEDGHVCKADSDGAFFSPHEISQRRLIPNVAPSWKEYVLAFSGRYGGGAILMTQLSYESVKRKYDKVWRLRIDPRTLRLEIVDNSNVGIVDV